MQIDRDSGRRRVGGLRADWHHPTSIRFGAGRAAELPDVCSRLCMRRPLLVTDPGLARLSVLRGLLGANRSCGIETDVFSGITSDPDGGQIADGAKVFKKGGYDGIVAFGGGSSLDAGKAIALAAAAGPKKIWNFVFHCGQPPPEIGRARIPPIVAVPTTAGTGSEVNAGAVITDPETRRKRSLFHPRLLPTVVIADPALTRAYDPRLTAATGMDALSHNLEALCAPGFYPMLDAVALQGLGFIRKWLSVAFHSQRSIEARAYTMAASIMGAVAFEKGLGAAHAMAHAVGALFKTHHGLTVGVVLPYVLRFNRRRIGNKMSTAARFLDLPRHDYHQMVKWIISLRTELMIPATLSELGVTLEHIPALTDRALADANAPTNPVPLDRGGMKRLFEWAVLGKG